MTTSGYAAPIIYDVVALGRYYQAQQAKENRLIVKRAAKREVVETEKTALVRD